MGGVPVKRHSKSKVGRRRSHLARTPLSLMPCPKCKAPTMPHKACPNCGFYKERKTQNTSESTK
ncbi:MAG: 50S ribosomal protein L32 [Candidatus Colwellbacteria bacterium]|nr:50S ribosomal protein L32 [Candidatus Colwellbacteria bacterium]